MTAKKLYLRSFGCQMNDYDSEKISDLLKENGYERTDDVHEADLVVFNTCSIREKAQEKVFSDLGRVREAKKESGKTDMVIAVGGCVASQEGKKILTRAPYVDIVFGPQTLHRLPAMVAKYEKTHRPQVDITFPLIEKFDHLAEPQAHGATAFVSIMEGCSKYCSYCVVPYTRGEEISRPLADVILEVAKLAARGVKEVTLLGQNVNAYRGETPDGEIADFATLLEYVAEIDGIERIRYTTSHPKEFTQRLIDAYGKIDKLVNHVHLPVQSGSDRILAAMKRGYTALEYKSIIRRLRAVRPDISIATDIIVGFPGETREDFEKTLELVRRTKYSALFTFIYSRRSGTAAEKLPDPIPAEEKSRWFRELLDTQGAIGSELLKNYVGKTLRVLAEDEGKTPGTLSCRAEDNTIVEVAAPPEMIGEFLQVRITAAMNWALRGERAE